MDKSNVQRFFSSPEEFINNLMIKDKKGKRVRFGDVMTDGQRMLIHKLQEHKQIAIVKARQLGISTVIRAYCFWEYYTSRAYYSSMCAAHNDDLAKSLLEMDSFFLHGLPTAITRPLEVNNQKHMKFSWNGSEVRSHTAGSRKQSRGYTVHTAHLSEYAYYDDAATYLGSVLASTNGGKVILESTPSHYEDPLHKIVTSNSPEWEIVFLPWYSFPGYRETPPGDFSRTEEEEELADAFLLTDDQLYWRRKKMSSYDDPWLFKRDYPITIEEAWTLGEDNYFTESQLRNLTVFTAREDYYEIKPDGLAKYVIGVDPAGGTGQDYSSAYVLDRTSGSIAAYYVNNKLNIRDFTNRVVGLARKYNNAFIHYELNNHGHAFSECLHNLQYNFAAPFLTTSSSKVTLFDGLRAAISHGRVINIDQYLAAELRWLEKHPQGLAPKHPSGKHDDRVISFALAIEAFKHTQAPVQQLMPTAKVQQPTSILSQTKLMR